MQIRDAVRLQRFDDAVKNQSDAFCGNEKTDDASNGVNPHRTQFMRELFRIDQTQIRDEHRDDDGCDNRDK